MRVRSSSGWAPPASAAPTRLKPPLVSSGYPRKQASYFEIEALTVALSHPAAPLSLERRREHFAPPPGTPFVGHPRWCGVNVVATIVTVVGRASLLALCVGAPAAAWSQPASSSPSELDVETLKDLARAPPAEPNGTAPPGSAKVGRPYRLVLHFNTGATSTAPAVANYDAVAQTLTLTFRPVGAAEGPGVELEYVTRPGRRLSSADELSPGLPIQAYRARKLDGAFVGPLPEGAGAGQAYAVTIEHVSSKAATVLQRSAEVVLKGRVAAYDMSGPSRCSIQTLRSPAPPPTLTNLVTCSVALSLDRIAITARERLPETSWPSSHVELAGTSPTLRPGDLTDLTRAVAGLSFKVDAHPPEPDAQLPKAPVESDAPTWVAFPSSEMVERFYPLQAYADGRKGDVALNCLELEDGRVTDCRILEEKPPGAGFGRAAVSLSRQFRFTPFIRNGAAVQVRIRIPYAFSVADDDAADRSVVGPSP